jgi:hypothetical protein
MIYKFFDAAKPEEKELNNGFSHLAVKEVPVPIPFIFEKSIYTYRLVFTVCAHMIHGV